MNINYITANPSFDWQRCLYPPTTTTSIVNLYIPKQWLPPGSEKSWKRGIWQ